MAKFARVDRCAALAVGAFTMLLLVGMSWLVGRAQIH